MLKTERLYLDHNATTEPARALCEQLPLLLSQSWGNPSSIHWAGQQSKSLVRESRAQIAKALGVNALELIFTSGGSESNNTVLHSIAETFPVGAERSEIITTQVEHPSILKTLQHLEKNGRKVHYIRVDRSGELDWEDLQKHLSEKTALVTMMLANNEFGTLFPLKKIAKLAHAKGALVHTDAVQALGKISFSLKELDVDYASFSAHKFYAFKGTGILYVKRGSPLKSLIYGGAQERQRRGGTENTLGIWSLGQMMSELSKVPEMYEKMQVLRDHMEKRILQEIPNVKVTAQNSARLPNTSSLIIPGVDGETLLMSLDLKGAAVSTGAACSSGNPEPSPALLALGLSRAEAQSSLRLSLGWQTSLVQIDQFVEVLKETVQYLRSIDKDYQENFQQQESMDAGDMHV